MDAQTARGNLSGRGGAGFRIYRRRMGGREAGGVKVRCGYGG